MPYRRIAVGTDGSSSAIVAEQCAGELALALGAELLLISVGEDEAAVSNVLEDASARVARLGVTPQPVPLRGDPASMIMQAAEGAEVGLLVVGDRGLGDPKRFTLGGLPDRLAHYSPVDILLVRTTDPDRAARSGTYKNVLIATDGSFTAYQAAGRGIGLAGALDAAITLIYVGDELVGDIVLRDTARRATTEVERRALRGKPGPRIIEAAASGHDLVVVGNKGMMGNARRFKRTAVPDEVAHGARCDVLICKTVGREMFDLEPGEGGVVDVDGQRVAVFIDDDGTRYTMSPKCQHLGCTVGWNSRMRTWDCPCHGSRYDHTGAVINGPTTKPLPPVELPSAQEAFRPR
ncbi:MAG TPA: universal stress protein [Acidimicrobiia bacterium]